MTRAFGLSLACIFGIALFLRSVFITSVPPELFGDEIDVGYQAYSLVKTGRDIGGQILPTYIHSLAEWRAPLLMYATVPAIALLGNSTLAVRLPEILLGALAPLLLAVLVHQTTKSQTLTLSCSLALCFMPWHIHYSRAAFEVILLLDLLMLGTACYLSKRYLLSLVFFALTIYTYSTAVVFTPLLILGLIFVTRKFPSPIAIVIAVVMLLPFVGNFLSGRAQERFGTVTILGNQQLLQQSRDLRSFDNSLPAKLLHNQYAAYFYTFLGNYYKSFSPEFLFIYGDPALRHGPQLFGNLLPFTAVFLLAGLYLGVRRKWWLWFLWLILAPIPAALTIDGGYHSTRLILMCIPLGFFIGAGIYQLLRINKSLVVLLTLAVFFQFTQYFHHYLVVYPNISWRWWQVGYRQAMTEIATLAPNFDRVYINNTYEPSIERFAFWTNYPPHLFQQSSSLKQSFGKYAGVYLPAKYVFGEFANVLPNSNYTDRLEPGVLYLISQRDEVSGDWDWRTSPPDGLTVFDTITNYLNQPLFYLVTRKV